MRLTDDLLFRFSTHVDVRGTLVVAPSLQEPALPFMAKRVFWITHIPTGAERGGHAHRTCHEALVAVQGSCCITLLSPSIKHNQEEVVSNASPEGTTMAFEQRDYELSSPDVALHIPPMVWCRLHSFSPDCALLCFASEVYNESGYINTLDNLTISDIRADQRA